MTIALGILCHDGLVVAADSQVTIQNYWKGRQGKISMSGHIEPGSVGWCVVTGATNRLGYLDSLAQQVTRCFLEHKDAVEKSDVERLFAERVAQFHLAHVAPYNDHPEVELVIGYERQGYSGLWTTSRGAMTEQVSYAAVGVGASVASTMLDRLWRLRTFDAVAAVALAVFVALQAKETVDGCGANTDVMCVTHRHAWYVKASIVAELEGICRTYVDENEPAFVWQLFGVQPPEHYQPHHSLRDLQKKMTKILNALRAEYQPKSPISSSRDQT